MRLCISLILVSSFASGQVSPVLSDYLSLTRVQLDAVATLKKTELDARARRFQQIYELDQEFGEVVDSGSPDAGQLGSLFVALELLGRDDKAGASKIVDGFRQLLSSEQVAKLTPLNDAQRLDPLIQAAACEGLLEAKPFSGVFFGFPATGLNCFFFRFNMVPSGEASRSISAQSAQVPNNPVVRRYLELTESAMASIRRIVAEALDRQKAMRTRRELISLEVESLRKQSVLDATALGLKLVDLVGIDRETLRIESEMVRLVAETLTEPQRAKLSMLQETLTTFTLYSESDCTGFFPRKAWRLGLRRRYDTIIYDPFIGWGSISGGCWSDAGTSITVQGRGRTWR